MRQELTPLSRVGTPQAFFRVGEGAAAGAAAGGELEWGDVARELIKSRAEVQRRVERADYQAEGGMLRRMLGVKEEDLVGLGE